VSISSTFYSQLFCVLHSFSSLVKVWLCSFFLAQNILDQKLPVKCWWNWLLDSIILLSTQWVVHIWRHSPKGVWRYQGFCDDCTQALVLKSVKGNVKKYQKLRDVIYGWSPTGKKVIPLLMTSNISSNGPRISFRKNLTPLKIISLHYWMKKTKFSHLLSFLSK